MIANSQEWAAKNAVDTYCRWTRRYVKQRIRTLREFAEQEIILPEGRFEGRKFRADRQPFAGLLLDELPRWKRSAVTGCVQSGKSLTAWVIPILYHLFEMNEPVIAGVPTMDQANDKWVKELLPVINRNPKLKAMVPSHGRGSRGGLLESIQFTNGVPLKFMSGGGGDEKRSSYTSRVLVCTEVDKMDDQSETSREADKISQLEARTAAYGDDARVYLECTVSVKMGRIWREYVAGTESSLMCKCVHCGEWVCPGRDDLQGWQTAGNEVEASTQSCFHCPACGEAIDDRQREQMNRKIALLHRGQEISSDGTVTGDPPPTLTLGFRWSAFNNLFWSSSFLGVKSWRAMRSDDEDNSEKEACQFTWATPYEPLDAGDSIPLTVESVIERQAKYPRGQVPEGTQFITIGVDVGKRLCHWVGMCFLESTAHIHDYGRIEVPSDDMGFERAFAIAISDFHDRLMNSGWTKTEYTAVLMDARWKTDAVCETVKKLKDKRWRVGMGLGDAHYSRKSYIHPDNISGRVVAIGHRWHEKIRKMDGGTRVLMMDANYWKSQIHERLTLPFNKRELSASDGGITLFSSMDPNEHLSFGKHLTAEREVLKFEPGRGHVKVWDAIRDNNHWLDAAYMALVAGVRSGFESKKPTPLVRQGQFDVQPGDTAPTFHASEDGFTAPVF